MRDEVLSDKAVTKGRGESAQPESVLGVKRIEM